ncbi:hypothetical protein ACQPXM_06720 [Kribbella sp. CA-253562]|uniref:hypothetical protein n=1 Tax=Kribbella sp. CA-253562 TaxID=3239942 RepID=UPI003D8E8414
MGGEFGARRRVLWIAGAVVLAIVAAAATWAVAVRRPDERPVSSGTPVATPAATPSSSDEGDPKMLAQIDAVLKARATAVLTGKLPQFLAHVDTKLRARQQVQYSNLRKLGLRSLSYRREARWVPEPQTQHGKNAYALRIMMLVQVAGIDPAPRYVPAGLTFAERRGRWLLVDDDDLAAEADRRSTPEPWDLGPLEVVRGKGIAVVVPPSERANGRRLVREAAVAVPSVRTATRRAQAGILVVALGDKRSFDADWQTGGHPAAAVAVPNYTVLNAEANRFKVTGSRIVIHPGERRDTGRFLLAHEFTHAAMAPLGRGAPTWLVEGFAEYVELKLTADEGHRRWLADQRRSLRREALPKLTVLPIDGVFHGDYDDQSYGVSWLIVEHLVTTYGLNRVNAFYTELAKSPDDSAVRDRALAKHFKLTESALVAAVKR